jgi:cell division protein ZapA
MSDGTKGLEVSILGRQYRVSCAPEEEKSLTAAVEYVDRKMNEIRELGKVVGSERIAVMAALNIAHELLTSKGAKGVDTAEFKRKISAMRTAIGEALADTQDKLFK